MYTFIYALIDPREPGHIRYIGKSDDPYKRLSNHISFAKANKYLSHKENWIRKLLADSVEPHYSLIEMVSSSDWPQREQYWISYFRVQGHNLTNTTEGGDSGYTQPVTEEARRNMSLAHTGNRLTEGHKGKIKEAVNREDVVEKNKAWHMGREQSEETKAKRLVTMSESSVKEKLREGQRKALETHNKKLLVVSVILSLRDLYENTFCLADYVGPDMFYYSCGTPTGRSYRIRKSKSPCSGKIRQE